MGLQIWRFEDLENILWATQTVMQANAALSLGHDRPVVYRRGFQQGFEATLEQVMNSYGDKLFSQNIWSRSNIEDTLLAARMVMQAARFAAKEKTSLANYDQGFNHGLEIAVWSIATAFGVSLLAAGNSPSLGRIPAVSPDPLFSDDIQNILAAIKAVMQMTISSSKDITGSIEYHEGFEIALNYIAKLFGIRLLSPGHASAPERKLAFWPRQEIGKKLLMIYQIIPAPASDSKDDQECLTYWQGFEAAVQCIATAFGLKLSHQES